MVQDGTNLVFFVVSGVFFMFFKDNSKIICVISQEKPSSKRRVTQFFSKSKKKIATEIQNHFSRPTVGAGRWNMASEGPEGFKDTVVDGEALWPDWPALLQTGGYCYHQQKGASFWTQIYNISLTLVPGVKSLLSTGRGIQETDDAKEAAQCPSTRRQPAS